MTCNMLLANEIFLLHRLGSFLSETNWKNDLHIKINIFANLPTRTRALKVNIDLKCSLQLIEGLNYASQDGESAAQSLLSAGLGRASSSTSPMRSPRSGIVDEDTQVCCHPWS